MTRRIRLPVAVAVVLALAAAQPVAAQPAPDADARAREYYQAGRKAADAGRFKTAVDTFEEGLAIKETPALVLGLAAAYRNLYTAEGNPAHLKRSIELFERFLEITGDGPLRLRVVEALQVMRPQWNQLVAEGKASNEPTPAPAPEKPKTQLMVSSQTPGARASVDGGKLGDTGIAYEVTPGAHEVRVEAPGFITRDVTDTAVEGRLIVTTVNLSPKPARVTVSAPAGASITVNGRSSPRSFEVPAGEYIVGVTKRGHTAVSRSIAVERGQVVEVPAPLRKTTQRKVSYYFFGGAAVLALAGTTTSVIALSAQGDAEDIDARRGIDPLGPADLADYDDAVDRRDAFRGASYVLLGTAAAAAVTGGLLYWFDTPRAEGATPLRTVVPTATGDGVGAAYLGTF